MQQAQTIEDWIDHTQTHFPIGCHALKQYLDAMGSRKPNTRSPAKRTISQPSTPSKKQKPHNDDNDEVDEEIITPEPAPSASIRDSRIGAARSETASAITTPSMSARSEVLDVLERLPVYHDVWEENSFEGCPLGTELRTLINRFQAMLYRGDKTVPQPLIEASKHWTRRGDSHDVKAQLSTIPEDSHLVIKTEELLAAMQEKNAEAHKAELDSISRIIQKSSELYHSAQEAEWIQGIHTPLLDMVTARLNPRSGPSRYRVKSVQGMTWRVKKPERKDYESKVDHVITIPFSALTAEEQGAITKVRSASPYGTTYPFNGMGEDDIILVLSESKPAKNDPKKSYGQGASICRELVHSIQDDLRYKDPSAERSLPWPYMIMLSLQARTFDLYLVDVRDLDSSKTILTCYCLPMIGTACYAADLIKAVTILEAAIDAIAQRMIDFYKHLASLLERIPDGERRLSSSPRKKS